jgi:transglutaminase-like putative cysteine protease
MQFASIVRARFLVPGLTLSTLLALGRAEELPAAGGSEAQPAGPQARTFLFTYDATVKDLPAGKTARIWIPLAQSNAEQDIALVTQEVPPGAKTSTGTDKQYGNKILYVEARANPAGAIPVKVTFRVTRREVRARGPQGTLFEPAPEEKIARYLEPDAKVPIGGKPLELIKGKEVPANQMDAAKVFYDVVNSHMTYSKKGTGWGQGDSVWACDSKYGNCSDFHSLFISLARAQKIPSKFVMGFPIPAQRGSGEIGGYHCWAWFLAEGKSWIPVDISEANQNPSRQAYYFGNLTENRVQFTTGRDINLAPRQSAQPLNFFIYPYVEVDGQPYPAENVSRHFTYQDVPGTKGK